VLAREAAKGSELLVVAGAEITRSMPPGHFNALFVKDVNKLLLDDPMEVFKEAARQEAFVMWNHPHWTAQAANGIVPVSPIHEELFDKGLVQGIEVYNEFTYSDEALELAIAHGLAPLGSSDVHGLVHHTFGLDEGGHRPITIVFAEKKNEESLKEALLEGRTVVWFDQTLVGQDAYLAALVETCIEVQKVEGALVQEVKLTNRSSSDFILRNTSDLNFHNKAAVFRVPARESLSLYVKTMEELQSFPLSFQVLNAFSAPDRHPKIQFIVK
jgi:hypothetical protein